MRNAVVYNPRDIPLRTDAGLVDARGWGYIEDVALIQDHLDAGRLIVVTVPENPNDANPAVRDHVRRYHKAREEQAPIEQELEGDAGLTEASTVDEMRTFAKEQGISLAGAERKAEVWDKIVEAMNPDVRDTEQDISADANTEQEA